MFKDSDETVTVMMKERFIAQYWNQKVMQFPGNDDLLNVIDWFKFKDAKLLLKSLDNCSKEDADKLQYTLVTVVGLDGLIRKQSAELVKEVISNWSKVDSLHILPAQFVDKCRELGYAIDWNGVSIRQQIELGWITVTE